MTWDLVAKFKVISPRDSQGRSVGPAGQPRARAARRGNITMLYTPRFKKRTPGAAKEKTNAEIWKTAVQKAWDDLFKYESARFLGAIYAPFLGPIRLDIVCYFQHPRTHYSGHGKSKNLRADAPIWREGKPDADNLLKLVGDVLEADEENPNRPWLNDSTIVSGRVDKRWAAAGKPGRMTITIYVWRGRETLNA